MVEAPVVRFGPDDPVTASHRLPVSSQTVSAWTNCSSSANAAEKHARGTPAAALAEPSKGSTTKVKREARSTNPTSSDKMFTPNGAVASTIADSTRRSMHGRCPVGALHHDLLQLTTTVGAERGVMGPLRRASSRFEDRVQGQL